MQWRFLLLGSIDQQIGHSTYINSLNRIDYLNKLENGTDEQRIFKYKVY